MKFISKHFYKFAGFSQWYLWWDALSIGKMYLNVFSCISVDVITVNYTTVMAVGV